MKHPPPGPGEQIAFLQKVQRLLEEGSFTTTYKYALLRALADLALERGDDTGEPLRISVDRITERMIELYWLQARPFPRGEETVVLRQITDRRKTLVDKIKDVRESTTVDLVELKRRTSVWKELKSKTRSTLRKDPLKRLQRVGQERLEFLYELEKGKPYVELRPGVAFCLRRFHPLIRDLVETAWTRFVRRYNLANLGESADLRAFLFGDERSPLELLQPLLWDYQEGRCFYCGKDLRRSVDVDHFIPWSKYPTDLGHNFVLAHPPCNGSKSAHLAWEEALERWIDRNRRHGQDLAEAFTEKNLLHDVGATTNIAKWAYSQTASAGGQVWRPGGRLEPLGEGWRELFLPPPAPPGQDLLGPEDEGSAVDRAAEKP